MEEREEGKEKGESIMETRSIENFRSTRERPHCRGMNGRNFPQFPPSFDRFSRPNTASMDRVSLWPPSALPLFPSSLSSFSSLFPRGIPRQGMTRERRCSSSGWKFRERIDSSPQWKIVYIYFFFWFLEERGEEIVLLKLVYFFYVLGGNVIFWISYSRGGIPRANRRFGNTVNNSTVNDTRISTMELRIFTEKRKSIVRSSRILFLNTLLT